MAKSMTVTEMAKRCAAKNIRITLSHLAEQINEADNVGLNTEILINETDVTATDHNCPKILQSFTAKITERY